MTIEERLKVALQSKSHHFCVGGNILKVKFYKDETGTIFDVAVKVIENRRSAHHDTQINRGGKE